jgi:hypothetical protein
MKKDIHIVNKCTEKSQNIFHVKNCNHNKISDICYNQSHKYLLLLCRGSSKTVSCAHYFGYLHLMATTDTLLQVSGIIARAPIELRMLNNVP